MVHKFVQVFETFSAYDSYYIYKGFNGIQPMEIGEGSEAMRGHGW